MHNRIAQGQRSRIPPFRTAQKDPLQRFLLIFPNQVYQHDQRSHNSTLDHGRQPPARQSLHRIPQNR